MGDRGLCRVGDDRIALASGSDRDFLDASRQYAEQALTDDRLSVSNSRAAGMVAIGLAVVIVTNVASFALLFVVGEPFGSINDAGIAIAEHRRAGRCRSKQSWHVHFICCAGGPPEAALGLSPSRGRTR